ncbi:MAG: hypothetical protein IT204_10080 [Fimbriimonadaceae bacterium]|nr:hypothetical protein [Fimbriimonadaceae bacterium]
MQVRWHIAFCNVTYAAYTGVSYREYYGDPAMMLQTQLAAQQFAEQRWGVGRFIRPHPDCPPVAFASYLGMPIHEPVQANELPYVDTTRPLVRTVADLEQLTLPDPASSGWFARHLAVWQYYRQQGHTCRFGGEGGGVVTSAAEISADEVLYWSAADPAAAGRLLDHLVAACDVVRAFDHQLCGAAPRGYIGDDYAGLLSPRSFRELVVPRYQRLYGDSPQRFLHSELLRAEHLRIGRDELGITMFHGAGAKLLTPAEMTAVMGERWWAQVTPQELAEWSPAALDELVSRYAQAGCSYVQLYPGRDTPEQSLAAAIAACQRECAGGPHW